MKFLVIDDHPVFREGMAALLRRLPDTREVLQSGDGADALELVATTSGLDLVFVDLRMQGASGLHVLAQLQRQRPALPVVVVSSSEDPDDVRRCLAAGARGYCPKSSSAATLRLVLSTVLAGGVYTPPMLASPEAQAATAKTDRLITPRQQAVLQALCRGLSNKQIARELSMEEQTVKGHVSAIFRLLSVVSRTQAVDAARRAGLLP
jgi:two-component system, NarL family, nitrate/nitrite response regulator NarL